MVDLIAAAQREIDAASASAEQLIRDSDFDDDENLNLDIDAFLESDSIAELVAQTQPQDASDPAPGPTLDVHARRAQSPNINQAAVLRSSSITTEAAFSAQATAPDRADQAGSTAGIATAPSSPVPTARSSSAAALPPKPTSVPSATLAAPTAVPEVAPAAATAGFAATTDVPVPGPAGPTAPVKDVAKSSAKQKRAHKNADAIRYVASTSDC